MKNVLWIAIAMLAIGFTVSCDEATNNDNSAAKVTGNVFISRSNPAGVDGVQIVLEASPNAEDPYLGPDRWTETDENGHYDAFVFLGTEESGDWDYRGDFLVQMFYQGVKVDSVDGVTLSPGSVFTMPPLYLN